MSTENLLESIKENLSGRPGQPMVLGVCNALATRFNQEVWLVRLVAIVFGVVWTLAVLAAYVILGLVLPETEARTRGVFVGLGIAARETAEKCIRFCRDLMGKPADRGNGTTHS